MALDLKRSDGSVLRCPGMAKQKVGNPIPTTMNFSSSFEGQTQTGLGPRVILLPPQTAALSVSDAGSGVIKPALSFVIQNRHTRAPYGARCVGHAVRTWSAVCSEAPYSQFGEGARPHLCMDEWNRPTPVRRRLSLTQAARGKPIPTGLAPVPGTKHGAWKHFHSTPFSICDLSIQRRGCQVWQGCPRDSAHLAPMGVWIIVSLGDYLTTHLKDHTRYDRGPEIHDEPRRVSLPFGEAQLAGCLRVQVGNPLEWDAGIQ